MVMEYDTAPKGEDDRKPPAPEGEMGSKVTAPKERTTASRCTASEYENDSKNTAPEGDADRKGQAPDGNNADCYMIHLPTALETQIRATVVNMRHLNNRFRVEDNHYIKLDGGSDISVFKHVQAFCVLRHEKQSTALGLTVGDNRLHPRNPCKRAGWRSFREKEPDCTEDQGSRMIAETNA